MEYAGDLVLMKARFQLNIFHWSGLLMICRHSCKFQSNNISYHNWSYLAHYKCFDFFTASRADGDGILKATQLLVEKEKKWPRHPTEN